MTEVNDGYVVAFSTRYGDGEYNDNNGNDYSVDFGMIGVISVNAIECRDDLKIVEFDNDFECCAENGVLYFGHIMIDTAHVDEDQEDENEGWYDEDEDSH